MVCYPFRTPVSRFEKILRLDSLNQSTEDKEALSAMYMCYFKLHLCFTQHSHLGELAAWQKCEQGSWK